MMVLNILASIFRKTNPNSVLYLTCCLLFAVATAYACGLWILIFIDRILPRTFDATPRLFHPLSLCFVGLVFLDLPMGLQKFQGDDRVAGKEELTAWFEAIRDVNVDLYTVCVCVCRSCAGWTLSRLSCLCSTSSTKVTKCEPAGSSLLVCMLCGV